MQMLREIRPSEKVTLTVSRLDDSTVERPATALPSTSTSKKLLSTTEHSIFFLVATDLTPTRSGRNTQAELRTPSAISPLPRPLTAHGTIERNRERQHMVSYLLVNPTLHDILRSLMWRSTTPVVLVSALASRVGVRAHCHR